MDPLALLSGSEASDVSETEEVKVEAPQGADAAEINDTTQERLSKRHKHNIVAFEDLQSAGYRPTELLESEKYLEDAMGQESRRPKVHVSEPLQTEAFDDVDIVATVARPPLPVEVRTNGAAPEPWSSFEALPPEIRGPLISAGLETPTSIQAHALPILRAGSDLVGIAPTGSGKTLAYLIPAFSRLLDKKLLAGHATGFAWSPSILVLAPTRELVCQIEQQAEKFRKAVDINVVSVYGGAPRGPQLAGLRGKPHLVVATPGRLNDFLTEEQASCSIRAVTYFVFDEADRMLDDGFEPQVKKILGETDATARQTVMFSATWQSGVQQLASEFLRSPAEIRVGSIDELRANADIAQEIIFCEEHEKLRHLKSLLQSRTYTRVIVFVATKRTCKDLASSIRGAVRGRCEAIHGDRRQEEREAALAAFHDGQARILVATDVAGRGLDVPNVGLVVNYDPPRSAEDYVHRIGRSGRAGLSGLAISLLTWRDREAERYIEEVMRKTGVPIPAELARRVCPVQVPDQPQASLTSVMTTHSELKPFKIAFSEVVLSLGPKLQIMRADKRHFICRGTAFYIFSRFC